MLSKTEAKLEAAHREQKDYGLEAQAIMAKADEEGRDRMDEENAQVAALIKDMDTCKTNIGELEQQVKVEQRVYDRGVEIGVSAESKSEAPKRVKSLGEQFTDSEGYKRVKASNWNGKWETGQVQVKTTLVEGDNLFYGAGTPGEGAALIPLDQRPGVLPILSQPLTVADLFASATTSSNAINYIVESVATSGAGVVPEGEDKPESTLEYENAQETVKKIATWLPVSDEMLEDAPAIQGFINSRLSLFVRQEEEAQLLGGAGGGNFLGLLPRIPAGNKFVSSDATDPNAADHVFEGITVVRQSFLEPDGVVINPVDWADLRLLKDQNDNYIGGSPFENTGQGEPGNSLWGKRVVITTAISPGSAVVGAFGTAAQVFRRGGLSLSASNSHDTFFVQNLTAIRAEERLALAVYRPEAFALVDLGYAS